MSRRTGRPTGRPPTIRAVTSDDYDFVACSTDDKDAYLAAVLGLTYNQVRYIRYKLGLKKSRSDGKDWKYHAHSNQQGKVSAI